MLKSTRDQLQYYKKKCKRVDKEVGLSECENCEQLTNENCKMKQTNIELMEANAELKDEVKQLQLRKLTTFEGGKYSDELRMCVI